MRPTIALSPTDSRTRTKSNLMVFLRPMVIRTQEDSNNLTMDRYESQYEPDR